MDFRKIVAIILFTVAVVFFTYKLVSFIMNKVKAFRHVKSPELEKPKRVKRAKSKKVPKQPKIEVVEEAVVAPKEVKPATKAAPKVAKTEAEETVSMEPTQVAAVENVVEEDGNVSDVGTADIDVVFNEDDEEPICMSKQLLWSDYEE